MAGSIRIVCLADTHGLHRQVRIPHGDILIHAGDITGHGDLEDVRDFNAFLAELPHRHKIVIAGNHDFAFERHPREARALMTACTYLQDEQTEVDGLRIYGSPWQPWFFDWAFNLQRGPEIRAKWDLIPGATDILVTHGPPLGHGDLTTRGERVGCADLLDAVRRVQPRYHVFGHIHEGYGVSREAGVTCINASICDVAYRPIQEPIVLEV